MHYEETRPVEAKQVLFFAYHAIFNRAVLRAGPFVRSCEIYEANVLYREDALHYHDSSSWVFREGVLRDSGINAISVLHHLMPGVNFVPEEVHASYADGTNSMIRLRAVFSTNTSCRGTLDLDWAYKGRERREVLLRTPEDTWKLDLVDGQVYHNGNQLEPDKSRGQFLTGEYDHLLRTFSKSIENGSSSAESGEIRFMEAVERMINSGGV